MSFLSVLKTIGSVFLTLDKAAAPFVSIFNPAIGGIMTGIAGRIPVMVVNAEQIFATAKSGVLKSQSVIDEFNLGLSEFQEILGKQSQLLTYDSDALQKAIDASVLSFNTMASLKTSFKVVPKT